VKDELPPSWVESTVGESFFEVRNGTSVTQNADGKGLPVSRIESIQNSRFDLQRIRHIEKLPREALENFRYRLGDIALSHINSYERVGKTALYEGEPETFIHGMNLLRLRLGHDEIEPRFAHLFMQTNFFREEVRKRVGHAVNQVSINQKNLAEVPLIVAPLGEQRRIVAKLEKLLGKVDGCQQRLAKIPVLLKRFRQSVLAVACSGRLTAGWREENPVNESASDLLVRIGAVLKGVRRVVEPPQDGEIDSSLLTTDGLPGSWAFSRLGLCFEQVKNGTTAAQNTEGNGHPVTRIETIQNFQFDLNRIRYTEELDADDLATFRYQPGDIAFSHINSFEHVGKTALYAGEPSVLVHGMNLLRLRLGHDFLKPRFIHLFMRTEFFRNEVRMRVGHAVNQVSINQKNLAQVPLVIPPLPEQQEIVRRVEALFALADQLEARCAKAKAHVEKLTQSILTKAFRGELVPQDPNDEPASILLERIRSQRSQGSESKQKRKRANLAAVG